MDKLIELSYNIQNSIFKYDVNQINKDIIDLINTLVEEVNNQKDEDTIFFIKQIIDNLNFAFCNRDYLLFGDILKYELEPNLKLS